MFRTAKDELTLEEIKRFVDAHKVEAARYQKLQNYYAGKHEILTREKRLDVPDHRIVNPYPRYITDTLVGYFVGQPILYQAVDKDTDLDDKLLAILMDVFRCNDEAQENLNLAKTCSIKGEAFEALWIDKDANVRFKAIEPDECFFIYDDTIEDGVKFAVRHYEAEVDGKPVETVTVYDREEVRSYRSEKGTLKLIEEPRPHYFDGVPVVHYENNRERTGDFEQVISLIDAYDLTQSNTLNDLEQFTDAYMVLVNMHGTTEEDVASMKRNRVLLVDNDGGARWLVKNVNDAWVENMKNRIKRDIHKFSATPDMTDENFGGNLSGVSLEYKLLGMEQIRANKERMFRKSLRERIRLITSILHVTNPELEYTGIDMRFNNTLPQNILETAQTIGMLSPHLSEETLIAQLPFVENAAEEIDKKRIEDEERLGAYNFDLLAETRGREST